MDKDLRIASSLQCPADTDFLRLRVSVQYPLWWQLTKPSFTFVEIGREDGTYTSFPILINPNQLNEVWVYPWENRQLTNYLAPSVDGWRIGDRAPITTVWLRFKAMDFFSVAPTSIRVDDLSAVTLSLR